MVASYQEQKPKTYGLEMTGQHDFVSVRLDDGNLAPFAPTLYACSQHGLNLTFLSLSPADPERDETLAFCLPGSNGKASAQGARSKSPSSLPAAC